MSSTAATAPDSAAAAPDSAAAAAAPAAPAGTGTVNLFMNFSIRLHVFVVSNCSWREDYGFSRFEWARVRYD